MNINIAHIYDEYGPVLGGGSAPTVVLNLSKTMAKWGHKVTVVERRHGNEPSVEYVDNVKFVRIEAKKRVPFPAKGLESPLGVVKLIIDGVEFAFKVKNFLERDNEFDVIHVHFPLGNSVLATIDRKIRKKMIYTAHVGEEGKRFKLTSDMPLILRLLSPDLYLMKRVRMNVVLNKPLKDKLVEKGISEEKIEVIPNGISVRDFGNFDRDTIERIKKKYGIDKSVTVMFAGSITPRKGVDYLVRAGERIIRDNKDVLFLLVGSPKYNKDFSKRLMEYVKNKNLDENIKFTGFVPYEDLKVLYSACDIFVLPSFGEGDPIALKEALASGKPLIGSNVGGIPMQIRDGWNGFLVEPGNEGQLVERIKYLVENDEERERMGRNSRKLAENEFDWSKIAEGYLKIYKNILK